MLFRLLILLVQSKNDNDTKINEIEKKMHDYGKCIATQEFNKVRAENFEARLKQANLPSKK